MSISHRVLAVWGLLIGCLLGCRPASVLEDNPACVVCGGTCHILIAGQSNACGMADVLPDACVYAAGGSSIVQWGSTAEYYNAMLECAAGRAPGIFVWIQGEADHKTAERAGGYHKRLADLLSRVGDDLHPERVVVTLQVTPYPYVEAVRQAKRDVLCTVGADMNMILVDTLGMPRKDDGIHLTPDGRAMLAEGILLWN